MNHNGNYIDIYHPSLYAFVGIDGAGKSTLIGGVSDTLRDQGLPVQVSKAYAAEQKIAFESSLATADDVEIMFMFQSFHRRQRNQAIEALKQGAVVLADRWDEAYDEFHSQNGPLSRDHVLRHQISRLAFEGLKPYNTFYVQLDPTIARDRTSSRSSADFFDTKPIQTHIDQARYYDRRAREDDTWVALDGTIKPEGLVERAVEVIDKGLGNR